MVSGISSAGGTPYPESQGAPPWAEFQNLVQQFLARPSQELLSQIFKKMEELPVQDIPAFKTLYSHCQDLIDIQNQLNAAEAKKKELDDEYPRTKWVEKSIHKEKEIIDGLRDQSISISSQIALQMRNFPES